MKRKGKGSDTVSQPPRVQIDSQNLPLWCGPGASTAPDVTTRWLCTFCTAACDTNFSRHACVLWGFLVLSCPSGAGPLIREKLDLLADKMGKSCNPAALFQTNPKDAAVLKSKAPSPSSATAFHL